MKGRSKILIGLMAAALAVPAVSPAPVLAGETVKTESSEAEQAAEEKMTSTGSEAEKAAEDREGTESAEKTTKGDKKAGVAKSEKIEFDPSWEYADKSKIRGQRRCTMRIRRSPTDGWSVSTPGTGQKADPLSKRSAIRTVRPK